MMISASREPCDLVLEIFTRVGALAVGTTLSLMIKPPASEGMCCSSPTFSQRIPNENPVSPVVTRTRLGEQCRRAIDVRSYSIFVSITGLSSKAQWQSLYYSSIGLIQ